MKTKIALLTLGLGLVGCAGMQTEREREIQAALVVDALATPEGRSQFLVRCAVGIENMPVSERSFAAREMHVNIARVPELVCERVATALVNGSMTAHDIVELQKPVTNADTMLRLMRTVKAEQPVATR